MDTFESRLQQVLTMEELSPANFADMLGIQRSGISHLLAGRNKPSYDFITRMLEHFPEINADWLLMGKGKPYKDSTAPSPAPQTVLQAPQPSAPQFKPDTTPQPQSHQMPQLFEEEPLEPIFQPSQVSENVIFVPSAADIPQIQNSETASKAAAPAERHIVRVTIFWSDGTYEEK